MPQRSNFFNKNVGINSEPKRNIKLRSMPNNRSLGKSFFLGGQGIMKN